MIWRLVLIVVAVSHSVPPAYAPNIGKLDKALSTTRDLDARFVQTRRSPLLDGEERSSGTLQVQKPGLARLEYKDPSPLVVWKRGDSAWVYTPALKQVVVSPTGASGVPVGWVLGASRADLRRDAYVHETGSGVDIVPHADAGLPWKKVSVSFGKDGFPNRYEFTESSGESVVIELKSVRRNKGIPAERFRPRFPAGTRVVDAG
ncbi:MAG TPA: outer membrane lipoprotein carrier protein LolA [Candidatus Eisenbacteria bacterium]|nr:outer membrane lipoprotein carrier protein LolA [Candidatus Eisenbacteria bacterium]